MTKEQLIALGVAEELAVKIAGESKKELEGYVEKAKFTELEAEKKQLNESNKTLTKQLEEVKKNVGDNEELKKQIESMQVANKAKEIEYADSITKIKLDNAIDIALMGAGSKNNKAVKALLDQENIKLKDDGTVDGLMTQIENLKKSDAYLFETTENKTKNSGFVPAPNPNNNGDSKPGSLADAVKSFFNK